MLQRKVKLLSDELKEMKVTATEALRQQEHWKTIKYSIVESELDWWSCMPLCYRDTVEGDLEIAEAKLEDAYATIEMEKRARYDS
jgi:hypothetical protein